MSSHAATLSLTRPQLFIVLLPAVTSFFLIYAAFGGTFLTSPPPPIPVNNGRSFDSVRAVSSDADTVSAEHAAELQRRLADQTLLLQKLQEQLSSLTQAQHRSSDGAAGDAEGNTGQKEAGAGCACATQSGTFGFGAHQAVVPTSAEPPQVVIRTDMRWDPFSVVAPCHNVTAVVPGQIHGDQLFAFATDYYDHAEFLECGVLFGQGSAYMAALAAERGRRIRVHAFDVFIWWSWMGRLLSEWNRPTSTGMVYTGQQQCAQSDQDVRRQWASDISRLRRGYGSADTLPQVRYFWKKAGVDDRIAAGKMDSVIAAAYFSERSLAFVYLDTDHTYDRTIAEIRAFWPKLIPGGTLSGDDFSDSFDGVRRAVRACFPNVAVSRTDPPQWAVQKAGVGIPEHASLYVVPMCGETPHKFERTPYQRQKFVGDGFLPV
eukprot:TRINITY_DN34401_c0_g1_i1.p1 TRINITY_DN34401_c0_g1~~TRINITY_DN34401_c0_g1_i1.p1  ORF type:complete len:432 (+),score=68.48 TRINITY_DN34401_c0_g1_i1:162-1457(+)